MPLKSGRLTIKERAFIGHMAATGDQTYSAAKAGYADPTVAGSKLSKHLAPNILAESVKRIKDKVLPVAVDRHLALIEDPKTPPGPLVTAIKLAYDAAGVGKEAEKPTKELHEMTADEIQADLQAAKLRQAALTYEASQRAMPIIEAEPSSIDDQGSVFE